MEIESGDATLSQPERILIISHDVVGAQMAGPGIRYYHLARVLSGEFAVVLAVPNAVDPDFHNGAFHIVEYRKGDWASIAPWVEKVKTIVCPSVIAGDFPRLADSGVPLVIDGYDPLLVEWLTLTQAKAQEQQMCWSPWLGALTRQYLIGDFFICASERQRDWWIGLLEAHGRINPWTFAEDASLRRLIDVVSYGLPETPPQHTRPVVRDVWQGIAAKDRVILWGGGLWPWLDPLTAIRALAQVWEQRQDVRLIFPGTRHPNPAMANIQTHAGSARELAAQLGLLDQGVFFGDWIPYADWQNVLLESDIALTLHYDGLETRQAFRSRVLDYIWAGLPTIAARGDAISELIARHDLGITVNCEDVEDVAGAMLRLLDTPRETFAERFDHARRALTWERVVQPLRAFCRAPRRAPDKVALEGRLGAPPYVTQLMEQRSEIEQLQGETRRQQDEIGRLQNEQQRLRSEVEWLRGETRRLQDEVNRQEAMVKAYERWRVVRLLNQIRRVGERLGWLQ